MTVQEQQNVESGLPAPEVNSSENRKFKVDDGGALAGLRGYAAIYIMVFHSLYYCTFHLNLHASVHMPLFFLLSGFCLTLAYGRKQYSGFETCCGPCSIVDTLSFRSFCCGSCRKKSKNPPDDEALPVFDSWKFYRNRFTRILPVFWLCMFFALPQVFLGYSVFPPNSLLNLFGFIEAFFGMSTMIILHGFGPNGPGWTVCTLSIFYWMFPNFLIRAQRWSNKKLTWHVVLLFWTQFILGLLIYHGFPHLGVPVSVCYWLATGNPLSRCPIFFMGVCAGLLCLRKSDPDGQSMDNEGGFFFINRSNAFVKDVYDKLPWVNFWSKKESEDLDSGSSQKSWKNRLDLNMFSYNLFLFVFTLLSALYIHALDYWKTPEGKDPTEVPAEVQIFRGGAFNVWLQFAFVHMQLMIIVGLCYDGGQSISSRFFRTKVMQFIGRISMSLYLIHEPIIYYIACCINGPLTFPAEDADDAVKEAFGELKKIPPWTLPIHWIISLAAGTILTIFVEEPAKRFLRRLDGKKSQKAKNNAVSPEQGQQMSNLKPQED